MEPVRNCRSHFIPLLGPVCPLRALQKFILECSSSRLQYEMHFFPGLLSIDIMFHQLGVGAYFKRVIHDSVYLFFITWESE